MTRGDLVQSYVELVTEWEDGTAQCTVSHTSPSIFEPLPGQPDLLRTVSGRENGELLRLTRDDSGVVVRMHWATYRVTRRQEGFDGGPASDGAE